MLKLLKRDHALLSHILCDLREVERFIKSDRFVYVKPIAKATTTIDLQDASGKAFTCPLNKETGTDLCILYTAINRLENALTEKE